MLLTDQVSLVKMARDWHIRPIDDNDISEDIGETRCA